MAHPTLKRLERAGHAALFGAAKLLTQRRAGSPPDWDSRAHRVLYLRYDRIGDMILATGLIRAIAQSHPAISLDVLASPANESVLDGNPHVRQVLLFDRQRRSGLVSVARALRAQRYDAVIDGMVLTPSATTMLLMFATGARYRIGIGGRRNDFAYTLPVPAAAPEAHIVEQSAQTAIPFGVDPGRADLRPELFLTAEEREGAERRWGPQTAGRRVLLNVSAVTADRQWPTERYVAVAREAVRLEPRGKVLLIAGPRDRDAAAAIADAAGVERADTPTVRDAFALIAGADAVFTPDTSISHAAAALDVPAAVMIPRASIFGPYGARHIRIESPASTLHELSLAAALVGLRDLMSDVIFKR